LEAAHDTMSNPYIDDDLMQAYVTYSPSENAKYLKNHSASKATQELTQQTLNTASLTPVQPLDSLGVIGSVLPTAHSQTVPMPAHNLNISANSNGSYAGVPCFDQDTLPLSHAEMCALSPNDIVYVLEPDTNHWTRFIFVGTEEEGFTVKQKVSNDGAFEDLLIRCSCDDDMPVMYRHNPTADVDASDGTTADGANANQQTAVSNFMLSNFAYKANSKIFVFLDDGAMTHFTILAFDPDTTKATLQDNSGMITALYLKQFRHESAETTRKGLAIVNNRSNFLTEQKSQELKTQIVEEDWSSYSWIERTNSMKLKWISYKNSLLGALSVATKHLYPVSLSYNMLMFVSGLGFGFHWLELDEDEVDDNDIIDQHLKFLGCDSSLDRTLLQIAKYSHYKLEKVCIPEVAGDVNSGGTSQRLSELEQLIVRRIDEKVCTITHDALGHFALIVGYKLKSVKDAMTDTRPTKFKFKVKGYTAAAAAKFDSGEYASVDLLDLRLVILVQPPLKEKRFSLQHALNPAMLQKMVADLVLARRGEGAAKDDFGGVHDLLGVAALERMSAVLEASKRTEVVSASLGKLVVFALIRLFDARKASVDFVELIEAKISNAFHSNTGSEEEWRFPKETDISAELKAIVEGLQRELEVIRRQHTLFEKYVSVYDGGVLGAIRWEMHDRVALKAAIDDVIAEEARISGCLEAMLGKLQAYNDKK